MDYEGGIEIERAWREGLTPDPMLTLSEWADRHRVLSGKSSSEPGRWRTSRTPYLKEIMDCLSPTSPIERIVFMAGGQLGKTECGNNWIGYVIHHAPGPMMAVSPTVEMAKRNSKQRIDPLIEESPTLKELIAPARSRDSGNTILAKEFRGGVLVMTGANSAVGLRSMPVRYLFLDEVDGYPLDVDGEGDAISLAEARTRTFARRKIFIVSTPTIAGASSIEREYEASDQRRYFVPCPHCGHRQWLRFEQLRWDRGQPETAAYVCESCDTAIAEHHKTAMLAAGEWRALAENNGRTAGFHLSSLYSPIGWRSWRDIAAAWEAAVSKETGSAAAIKTFKNTELGETWVEEGEAPDWQRLLERREDYRIGNVPTGGLLLVGGADVQKDRIEASIWAFGRGKAAWLIEHRVLMGDTARETVWRQLALLLAETWSHDSGARMPLARFALDTGFATQEAYAFVRAARDPRVMAVKGVARGAALIGTPTAVDLSQGGKRLRRGIKVFAVAGGIAKLEFYNNLRKSADVADDGVTARYPAGFVHLPKVDAEFVQQLCAEQLVTRRDRNGFPVREWQKTRERNEALDCYVYARAAASAAGLDRFEERHWRELERQLGLLMAWFKSLKRRLLGGTPVYDGTGFGRRTLAWAVSNPGAVAALAYTQEQLRAKSRDLVRRNAWAAAGVEAFVANAIGTGIKPQSMVADAAQREAIQRLWWDWCETADAAGLTDFYGLQALATRAMLEGGEALVRLRLRRPEDGLPVALQVQVLEAEHLPLAMNRELPGGNVIRAGIEFDRLGRRVAYHLYRSHPNDGSLAPMSGAGGVETVRIPAEEIIHLFRPLRPGQIRGEPWLARALVKLDELDQYDDAELVRKKTAAMFAGFITRLAPEDNLMGEGTADADGVALAGLEPGTLQILEPGEDIKFSAPADVGSSYAEFMRQQFRAVAAAMGITYEMLTGDLTQVNYSSIRAGLLEFRRRCEAIQYGVIVHQLCRPIWRAWMDQAVLEGALALPGYARRRREYQAARWIPQGWQWVDPQKEFNAMKLAIRAGLMSRSEAISAYGYDAEDVDREIAADNRRADELGLVFDSDPRHDQANAPSGSDANPEEISAEATTA